MTSRTHLGRDEEAAWMALLALVEFLPGMLDQQLKRDSDLGRYEYGILLRLHRAVDHDLPMLELSSITYGSLSRLSHAVSRLEARALVRRRREGASRRVSLTPAGRRALAAAAPVHVEEIRRLVLDHLPADAAASLAEILTPVVEHLKAIAPRS